MGAKCLYHLFILILEFISLVANTVETGLFSLFSAYRSADESRQQTTTPSPNPSRPFPSGSTFRANHYIQASLSTPSESDGKGLIVTPSSTNDHHRHTKKNVYPKPFATTDGEASFRLGSSHSDKRRDDPAAMAKYSDSDQTLSLTNVLIVTVLASLSYPAAQYMSVRTLVECIAVIILYEYSRFIEKSLKSLVQSYQSRVASHKAQARDMAAELEKMDDKRRTALKHGEKAYQELRDQDEKIEGLVEQNACLQGRLKNQQEEIERMQNAPTSFTRPASTRVLSKLEQRVDSRRLDLQAITIAITKLSLSGEQAEQGQALAEAPQTLDDAEILRQERDAAVSQFLNLETTLDSVQKELARAKEIILFLWKCSWYQIYLRCVEKAPLREALAESQNEIAAMKAAGNALPNASLHSAAQEQISGLLTKLNSLQEELAISRKETALAEKQAEEARVQVTAAQAHQATLSSSLVELQEKLANAEQLARNLGQERDAAQEEASTMSAKVKSIQRNIAVVQEETGRVQAEHDASKAEYKEQVAALRRNIQNLRGEKEAAQASADSMSKLLDRATADGKIARELVEEERTRNVELERLLAEAQQALAAAKDPIPLTPPYSATFSSNTSPGPSGSQSSDRHLAVSQPQLPSIDESEAATPSSESAPFRPSTPLPAPAPTSQQCHPTFNFTLNIPHATSHPVFKPRIFDLSGFQGRPDSNSAKTDTSKAVNSATDESDESDEEDRGEDFDVSREDGDDHGDEVDGVDDDFDRDDKDNAPGERDTEMERENNCVASSNLPQAVVRDLNSSTDPSSAMAVDTSSATMAIDPSLLEALEALVGLGVQPSLMPAISGIPAANIPTNGWHPTQVDTSSVHQPAFVVPGPQTYSQQPGAWMASQFSPVSSLGFGTVPQPGASFTTPLGPMEGKVDPSLGATAALQNAPQQWQNIQQLNPDILVNSMVVPPEALYWYLAALRSKLPAVPSVVWECIQATLWRDLPINPQTASLLAGGIDLSAIISFEFLSPAALAVYAAVLKLWLPPMPLVWATINTAFLDNSEGTDYYLNNFLQSLPHHLTSTYLLTGYPSPVPGPGPLDAPSINPSVIPSPYASDPTPNPPEHYPQPSSAAGYGNDVSSGLCSDGTSDASRCGFREAAPSLEPSASQEGADDCMSDEEFEDLLGAVDPRPGAGDLTVYLNISDNSDADSDRDDARSSFSEAVPSSEHSADSRGGRDDYADPNQFGERGYSSPDFGPSTVDVDSPLSPPPTVAFTSPPPSSYALAASEAACLGPANKAGNGELSAGTSSTGGSGERWKAIAPKLDRDVKRMPKSLRRK
ncbi:hypothetical protein FRB90_004019 [Tulasnella sp. 427]|nr:hypothetical protein FRB90_004019 [Tulasnella sp. 427]